MSESTTPLTLASPLPPAIESSLSTVEMLSHVLRTRRTIGAFTPDGVDPAIVRAALELACWAPNHRKTEPWRFVDIGPETRAQIVALNSQLIAARKGPEAAETKQRQWSRIPGWLAVTCVRNADPLIAEEDYAACCCAIQNFTLALWSHGVGSKWSTGDVTRTPEFHELLQIDPSRERMVGLIWYGYPDSVPQQSRRPLDEVTRMLP